MLENEVVNVEVDKATGLDTLHLADGSKAVSNFTVLATGNIENINYKDLQGKAGYFS